MGTEWVVLELSPKAAGEDPDLIRQSLRHHLRDAEVFIPAVVTQVGEDKVFQYLLEGYAFIRRDHGDERYFRLEGSKYVQSIISRTDPTKIRHARKVVPVSDAEILKLRKQIMAQGDQGISVGDEVLILSGPYRNIRARVIEDIPEKDHVQLYIQLRSKEALLTFPRASLQLVSKAPEVKKFSGASRESIRRWLELALPLSQWDPSTFEQVLEQHENMLRMSTWDRQLNSMSSFVQGISNNVDASFLRERWELFDRFASWATGSRRHVEFLRAMGTAFNFERLRHLGGEVERLKRWTLRWDKLRSFVQVMRLGSSISGVESRYVEWEWLRDACSRMESLQRRLDELKQQIEEEMPVDNILVDGNNLAVRCGTAPGLDKLKDKQGRPSGVIVGFLRSLASLRKKYPGAAIYVCWDGSPQRRKSLFSTYKEGRVPFDGYPQILWLRGALPSFGVHQVHCENEEADDVIATMVRRRLSGKNIIFSTDRDLFQLVTPTTEILYPSIAGRPEKVYTRTIIVDEYGLSPEKLVHLRALTGDDSDKIPGVSRLPEKVARRLVQMYGSVDGILSSNLPELTRAQQEKIRASAAQLRMNVRLMTLVDDLDVSPDEPKSDMEAAANSLQDVDVKSDTLLGSFFQEGLQAGSV